jgi:dTDP-4-dehydrorhamnose 3,5-epimerase-like enzyme
MLSNWNPITPEHFNMPHIKRAGRTEVEVLSDNRGTVFEPVTSHELRGMRNMHVVITRSGEVRGNHYHEKLEETLAILGPALLRVREGKTIRDFTVPAGEVHRFTLPPRVSHAVKFTGDHRGVLVSFGDREFDRLNPDVVADLLIE